MSNLPVINLFDSNFPGHACSVPGQTPRLMRYEREQLRWDGLTIFTDGQMYSPIVGEVTSRYKIGWLMESQALHPENYYRLPYYEQKFDAILTTRPELLARDPQRYRLGIRGGVWTPRAQWGMHPKSRSISMILSDKRTTEGHQLRHQIAATVPGIDLYGPEYTPIGHDKRLALQDYRYTVVVENERSENYFSEQALDAIAFGCIPLYWGGPQHRGVFRRLERCALCGYRRAARARGRADGRCLAGLLRDRALGGGAQPRPPGRLRGDRGLADDARAGAVCGR
jgi:hypothetical protein